MRRNVVAAVALLALGFGGSASAVVIVGGCQVTDVTNGGVSATSCQGLFTGTGSEQNDSLGAINDLFGGGFSLLGKSDAAGSGVVTSGGTWSAPALGGYTEFVVALKQSTYWAGYYFDSLHGTGGTWSTGSWDIGNPAGGLSHLSIYAGTPRQVPEPGTLALLGMGLLGIAASARRRPKA